MSDLIVSVDWNRRVKLSIAKQQGDQKPEDVKELQIYDSLTDYSLLAPFTGLEVLVVHQPHTTVRVKSLKNFPHLQNLKELVISDHLLADLPEDFAERYPSLTTLGLTNNKFYDIKALEPLKNCRKLTTLEVEDNPFTSTSETPYREHLFKMVDSVQIIDNANRDGSAVCESDEEDEEDEEHEEQDEDDENSDRDIAFSKRKRDEGDDDAELHPAKK
eukprot:TRINITY_DN3518_c2_g2_i1.p1 TRINITY_DN3518_c2_g2~~TRINITY_DN3518_c2_g2_i1.p1  ORF type:complete len:217 (+),score=56.70 TRINITY_DN3518_c2_g2_i1:49-699(+)